MADATAHPDNIPCSDPATSDAGSSVVDKGVKHPIDEESSEVAPKKFKSHSKDAFQNVESVRRKKAAVLLAYCGFGYYGMQRNPGMKTIEEDLLSSLLKAGLINQENFEIPQTMHFQRAARTDKGVSAARQVVSLRIALSPDLVEKINAHLPSTIRVLCIKRTTKGFNAKFWCDARTYSYTLPTFAFAPVTELTTEAYRISEDVLEKVNSVLQLFKGTHNFHNFTSGRKPEDASAKRYIMEIECGKPFVDGGLELVVITVKGQSFMLHQIRKMIGITIAILRDLTTTSVIEKAWNDEKVDIPIAPGVGLMLEQVHYEKYNKRYAHDGLHDALIWDGLDETVERFKREHIYLPLLNAEMKEKSMFNWLSTLPFHSYDVRDENSTLSSNRSQTRNTLGYASEAIKLLNEKEQAMDSIPEAESIPDAHIDDTSPSLAIVCESNGLQSNKS